jgi:hypothetical protein
MSCFFSKKRNLFFTFTLLLAALGTRAQIVSNAAGNGSQAGTNNSPGFTNYYSGPATNTPLFRPIGVATDDSGNFYIADQVDNTIMKVTVSTGNMTQVAGNGFDWGSAGGFSGDGGQATAAEFYQPTGLAVDDSGNIYIADQVNNVIRKVTKATGIIITYAGNYSMGAGFSGDGGQATAAQLSQPFTVALDDSGDLYIADAGNACIRKVTKKTSVIQTLSGRGVGGGTDGAGDGTPATNAVFSSPDGLVVDDSGNVYIADQYDMVIRKITVSRGDTITRIAGGTTGYSGNGGPATDAALWYPSGVAVDDSGNVYFADDWNDVVRKVNQTTGVITLYAGNNYDPWNTNPYPPYGGYVNGPALSAELAGPSGIALDLCGNLYEADYYNNVIREISAPGNAVTATTTSIPSSSAICLGQSVSFIDSSNFNATSWKWHFPGGTPDSAISQSPSGIQYNTAGTYDVIVTASNFCVGSVTDTVTHITVSATGALSFVPASPTICNGQSINIKVIGNDTSFNWSPSVGLNDTTGDSVIASLSLTTTYTVIGTNAGGCISTGTDTVTVNSAGPFTILPQDTAFCSSQSAILYVSGGGSNFIWTPVSGITDSILSLSGDSITVSPTVTTTYTVTGINTSNCATSGTDVVTIIPSPGTPTFTQVGDTLISSSVHDNQWYRNDTLLENDTSQHLIINSPGEYYIVVTNEVNGCSTSSDSMQIKTGIDQLSVIGSQVSIHPNPFNNDIVIKINISAGEISDWNLQVMDVLGRTLYSQQSLDDNNEIDLSNLANGIYFIAVTNKMGRAVFSAVKQN